MKRDEHTPCSVDPTLARAIAICRANGLEPRPARELAAQDEELRRLRAGSGQLPLSLPETHMRAAELTEGLELSDARAELERLRELRREDLRIVGAAMRLTRAEALAARTSTSGPAVLVHEREAMESARELRDACADVAVRRIARALRETDDAPLDTPAAVDALAHELRAGGRA